MLLQSSDMASPFPSGLLNANTSKNVLLSSNSLNGTNCNKNSTSALTVFKECFGPSCFLNNTLLFFYLSPEIDFQPGGPVRQPYLTYRRERLHRLSELISWNRFLGFLSVYKFGLCFYCSTHAVPTPFENDYRNTSTLPIANKICEHISLAVCETLICGFLNMLFRVVVSKCFHGQMVRDEKG